MKRILKKSTKYIVIICLVGIMAQTALAANGSFSSTYNMHVGIITQKKLYPTKKIKVKLVPTQGQDYCTFSLYYGHYGWLGFSGDTIANGLSTTGSSTSTYNTSDSEQVYLRTWQQRSGDRFKGNITCSWE